jgi:hypothetical protein
VLKKNSFKSGEMYVQHWAYIQGGGDKEKRFRPLLKAADSLIVQEFNGKWHCETNVS